MKKLLIAYDGSPCSDAMLDELSHAGLRGELDATVLSVADVWLPADPELQEPAFPDPVSKAVRQARARAVAEVEGGLALAKKACEHLKKLYPKWNLRPRAVADSPAWGIIKEAAACKADLIVLGSHGRSPAGRFFLGSVAHKVAGEAHRSVRIARPQPQAEDGKLRILIGADGSHDSQAAVHAVALRRWPFSAEFRIIAVVDPRMRTAVAWPGVYPEQWDWAQARDKSPEDWVARMLQHSAAKLIDAGFKAETDFYDGDPKQVLLREAEDWKADCIFLGARGLHHGTVLTLGTTASAVATRAHCSVEIVRPH
jgi:nucleotide-binding universal stress UspA family protein